MQHVYGGGQAREVNDAERAGSVTYPDFLHARPMMVNGFQSSGFAMLYPVELITRLALCWQGKGA